MLNEKSSPCKGKPRTESKSDLKIDRRGAGDAQVRTAARFRGDGSVSLFLRTIEFAGALTGKDNAITYPSGLVQFDHPCQKIEYTPDLRKYNVKT
jgi:hypothetical protein